jgi:hypothetical protein
MAESAVVTTAAPGMMLDLRMQAEPVRETICGSHGKQVDHV